jgi:hypothetical protein
VDGHYLKDLNIIARCGVLIDQMVLLDNSMVCFALNLDNGIPIPDFYGFSSEAEDKQLIDAAEYIDGLFQNEDQSVPEQLREEIKLSSLLDEYHRLKQLEE